MSEQITFQRLRALGLTIAGASVIQSKIQTLEMSVDRYAAAHAAQVERNGQLVERLKTVEAWALQAIAGTQDVVREQIESIASIHCTPPLRAAYDAIYETSQKLGVTTDDLPLATGADVHASHMEVARRSDTVAENVMSYAHNLEAILRKLWEGEGAWEGCKPWTDEERHVIETCRARWEEENRAGEKS